MIPGINTGGGGLSANSSAASRSGDAGGSAGGSQFSFNFGGNPNVATTNYALIGLVVVAGLFVWKKYK